MDLAREDLDDHRRVCEEWSRTDDSLNDLVHDALTRHPHQPNAEWGLQRRAASRINRYPQGVTPREGLLGEIFISHSKGEC